MLTLQVLTAIAVFLKRTHLKGDEVPAFNDALNAIDAEFQRLAKAEAQKHNGKKDKGKKGKKSKTTKSS